MSQCRSLLRRWSDALLWSCPVTKAVGLSQGRTQDPDLAVTLERDVRGSEATRLESVKRSHLGAWSDMWDVSALDGPV